VIAHDECKQANFEKEKLIADQSQLMKDVARNARLSERQHLSKAVSKHKVKTSELTNKLTYLMNRKVDAKKEAKAAVLKVSLVGVRPQTKNILPFWERWQQMTLQRALLLH
jgi:hypothetical protein